GGRVGRAGLKSRPRVPTGARCFASLLVVEHARVDDIGESAFEGAHRHHRGHAAGFASVVVGAAFGGVPQLHDGHDVQGAVDAPVAGAGEPVALLVAGGGIQRRGAVPGGEPVAVAEAVNVASVDE